MQRVNATLGKVWERHGSGEREREGRTVVTYQLSLKLTSHLSVSPVIFLTSTLTSIKTCNLNGLICHSQTHLTTFYLYLHLSPFITSRHLSLLHLSLLHLSPSLNHLLPFPSSSVTFTTSPVTFGTDRLPSTLSLPPFANLINLTCTLKIHLIT